MRNVEGRSAAQALKMRSVNSNAAVAGIIGLERPQQVSDIVTSAIRSFEEDVLPFRLGISFCTQQDLIQNGTSDLTRARFGVSNSLTLIYDGTYVRHGKSAYSSFQGKKYSGQKETHLIKPFPICTTTGYVIDMLGPFPSDRNDAQIMKDCVEDPSGLGGFLKAGDVCFVDQGFRDVRSQLEGMV